MAKGDRGLNTHILRVDGPAAYFVRESCIHSVINFGPTLSVAWEDRYVDVTGASGSLSFGKKLTQSEMQRQYPGCLG
jgi:hypothetical protein